MSISEMRPGFLMSVYDAAPARTAQFRGKVLPRSLGFVLLNRRIPIFSHIKIIEQTADRFVSVDSFIASQAFRDA